MLSKSYAVLFCLAHLTEPLLPCQLLRNRLIWCTYNLINAIDRSSKLVPQLISCHFPWLCSGFWLSEKQEEQMLYQPALSCPATLITWVSNTYTHAHVRKCMPGHTHTQTHTHVHATRADRTSPSHPPSTPHPIPKKCRWFKLTNRLFLCWTCHINTLTLYMHNTQQ